MPSADGGNGRPATSTLTIGGNNIGEELTTSNTTWGWFEGGFVNGFVPGHGTQPATAQICSQTHKNAGGNTVRTRPEAAVPADLAVGEGQFRQ